MVKQKKIASKKSAPKLKHIVKRSGEMVDYDLSKITGAVFKAMKASAEGSEADAKKVAVAVEKELFQKCQADPACCEPSVEEIQDLVEKYLMEFSFEVTAKNYILYREQHKQIREIANAVNNGLVAQYLDRSDWQVKENSNMSYSLQGLNNYVASEISKNYWLNKVYSPNIRRAHTGGDFHLHDLNILSVYCVGWDLYDLLMEGFTGVAGKISSKAPKHFRSALGQVVNFFYTLQGEAAGAQAFSNFDTLLAPFIRFDKLTYKEVRQALQEFFFNINVPTRVGFQTPFTNVTLDLTIPKHYAKQPVVIGGELQKEKYEDFQAEMDMFNKAFLEVTTQGDASGRVFTFPIPTYNITKDFDWDSEVSKQLWQVTGKYGLPYFSNFINSDMSPDDARSMCCRLRIDNRQLKKLERRGGGLFGANPLTGSIGVVTINMPRIGHNAKNKKEFLARLKDLMVMAKESLEVKRKVLEEFTEANLYPYTKYYLRNMKAAHGTYWQNHFSTIGLVGMNEAMENLLGKGIATPEGNKFATEALVFMRDLLADFQKETGNNYNLEATPAEGTSFRLALLDQKKYEDAIFANGKGREVKSPFYTNSTHLPVNYTKDVFEALDLQDGLQTQYTGGTVMHFFLGEKIDDTDSVKNLVKKICNSYNLPYFTLTPTFSVCPEHGYLAGAVPVCDKCHNSCEVYSRIVGYLRPVAQWNDGKKAEYDMRNSYNPDIASRPVRTPLGGRAVGSRKVGEVRREADK